MNKINKSNKTIHAIQNELCKLDKLTVKYIKTGVNIFFILFAFGTLLLVLNRLVYNHDSYKEFIGTSIVTSSFTILAIVIVGCLLIDSIFNKDKQ